MQEFCLYHCAFNTHSLGKPSLIVLQLFVICASSRNRPRLVLLSWHEFFLGCHSPLSGFIFLCYHTVLNLVGIIFMSKLSQGTLNSPIDWYQPVSYVSVYSVSVVSLCYGIVLQYLVCYCIVHCTQCWRTIVITVTLYHAGHVVSVAVGSWWAVGTSDGVRQQCFRTQLHDTDRHHAVRRSYKGISRLISVILRDCCLSVWGHYKGISWISQSRLCMCSISIVSVVPRVLYIWSASYLFVVIFAYVCIWMLTNFVCRIQSRTNVFM